MTARVAAALLGVGILLGALLYSLEWWLPWAAWAGLYLWCEWSLWRGREADRAGL